MKILIVLLLVAASWLICTVSAGCEDNVEGCSHCEEKTAVTLMDFTADKTTVHPGDWVNFSAHASDNVEGYHWMIDGATEPDVHVQFVTSVFAAVGAYTVTLSVDNCCYFDKKTKSHYIHVIPYDSVIPKKPAVVNFGIKKQ